MSKVNYDERTIKVDDRWYSQIALSDKINEMLDMKDFRIAKFGKALEVLDKEMEGAEEVHVVLPEQTVIRLNKLVSKSSRSVGDYIREALKIYLRTRAL